MKLLFDQNLSQRLAEVLATHFPGTVHVRNLGLERADDLTIWSTARRDGYTIVTKDSDFHELGLIRGFPPKVVWIRLGNCSTEDIQAILVRSIDQLARLADDPEAGFIALP